MRKPAFLISAAVLAGLLWVLAAPGSKEESASSEFTAPVQPQALNQLAIAGTDKTTEVPAQTQLDSSPQEESDETYILDCSANAFFFEDEEPDVDLSILEEQSRKQEARLSEFLKAQPGLDADLVRAMVLQDEDQAALLRSVLDRQPQNGIAQLMLLRLCKLGCDRDVETEAIRAAGNNGYIWFQVADNRIARQDVDGALEAIQRAASASQYDEYVTERLDLLDRVIPASYIRSGAAISDFSVSADLDLVSDSAVSFMYGFSVIIGNDLFAPLGVRGFCTRESLLRADIEQACFQLGIQMAENGQQIETNQTGYMLQKQYYERLEDLEGLAEVETGRNRILEYPEDFYFKSLAIAFYDGHVMDLWRQEARAYGEAQASNTLVNEAIRLSSDPNYNPCP